MKKLWLFLLVSFQVVLWAQQNFLLSTEIGAKNGELDLKFLSARTQLPLQITMSAGGSVCFIVVIFKSLAYCVYAFVCVTGQHYVSIFFTRLWSVPKPMLF